MSYDIVIEDVPALKTRVGDHAIHGSNNSVMILGRDRAKDGPATVDDGMQDQTGTGTVHIIAGRTDRGGDPDFKKDLSFFYLAMKTDVDKNLAVQTRNVSQDNGAPAAVLKSDHVRVMTRKNIKILMEDSKNFVFLDKDHALISISDAAATIDVTAKKISMSIAGGSYVTIEKGKIVVDGNLIELGAGATQRLIQGDNFKEFFLNHKHPTGIGPSGPVLDPWIDEVLLSTRKVQVR